MLDILRQNAKNVLTYVLFGIIILVFVVSFGPGSRGCADARVGHASWAISVNGDEVSGAEFEQHYANLFRSFQARAGQGFTREQAELMGLRRAALDQLVERQLLLQEGARLGVVVTDEELNAAIQQNSAFHTGGQFDKEMYLRAVSNAYGTAARFEERFRSDLLKDKVLALLRSAIQVSEEEVRQAFAEQGDRVSLEFVRFPIAAARAEVKATPEQVRAFQARSAARIAQDYKENAAKWDRKKRVRSRHVLFRVDPKAPAEADAAARRKAEEVIARARKGEDFAGMASALSEDPGSKERGGDLGWFSAGVMARPFEEAAFGAAAGSIVGPVRTPFGWHALQVVEVQEPEAIPLERAAPEIARDLLESDLARELAGRRAAEALARARGAKSLRELFPPEPGSNAKGAQPVKMGGQPLRAEETGSFAAGARPHVPQVGAQPALFADAFAASGPGLLPKVYDAPAGPVLARVVERLRPDPAQFTARRTEAEERLRGQREAQVERAWMTALREKAEVKVNEAYARGEVNLPPVELD